MLLFVAVGGSRHSVGFGRRLVTLMPNSKTVVVEHVGCAGTSMEGRTMSRSWHDSLDRSAPLGTSRARALRALQDAGRPIGVQEMSALLELHPNTARIHLDALTDAGLVSRERQQRDTPGRPRTVYAAAPGGAQDGPRNYRMLSQVLTSVLAASLPEHGEVTLEAGRAWGRYLSQRPIPYQQVDAEGTVDQLHTLLAQVGFAPERGGTRSTPRPIRFRNCPFREVAEDHPDIVCTIHLGIMQGALDEMDSPLTADRLEPFVQPTLCVGYLSPLAGQRAVGPVDSDDPSSARPIEPVPGSSRSKRSELAARGHRQLAQVTDPLGDQLS